ncbi:uncharacterized protein PV06_10214 [Exophiala oligosperma]|uniref:Uncharacterized protein n=1 Tax=Exophiala oligosperma TaxID=215243 RepID=A0A0D2D2N8_9EURO|nr:uncharacterized protein PV06_10214 [Exophiala oligosperma]KIW37568.1 hypothetical protein PV06_10214 [Exophiala oligosperma]
MTSLLDNTGLPLWVYIVLIVVGSTLLVLVCALSLRWCLRRGLSRRGDLDNLTGATRRVTLRRGRVVPTSQHLSLTGSKFGMRQFGLLGDNESTMTGRRSPFEWWNTVMAERSHSRLDQMSQVETSSVLSSRPVSRSTRRDMRPVTPIQTPEKSKEATTRSWEITPPSASPSPSPSSRRTTVNFSRSFSTHNMPVSPLTQRSQHTLSRISERSPHQSMISTNSPDLFTHSPYQAAINPVDSTPIPSLAQSGAEAPRRPSYLPLATPKPIFSTSQTPSTFRSSPLSTPPLAQDADSFSASVGYSQPTYQSAYSIAPRPRTADATISRKNGIENLRQSNIPVPDIPAPKSVVYPTPTSMTRSMYQHSSKSQPDLTKRTSMTRGSKRSSGATMLPPTPKSGSTHGPSGILYEPQVPDYWSSSRLDVQDLSSTLRYDRGDRISGQYDDPVVDGRERENVLGIVTVPGKHDTRVLRKKSLKRMTRTSSVAV